MADHNEINQVTPRFSGWRDAFLSPVVEIVLLAVTWLCTRMLHVRFHLSFFTDALLFYLFLVVLTLLLCKGLRHLFPESFKEGVYSETKEAWRYWVASLHAALCITNLTLHQNNSLMPPPLRKFYYKFLGASVGKGVIVIGGKLADPHLTTLESKCMLGEDSFLICHAYLWKGSDYMLITDRITVHEGATVGARSVLMPGVTVGRYATIEAMSYVPMGTTILPYEIWGGHPAKKIRTIGSVVVKDTDKPLGDGSLELGHRRTLDGTSNRLQVTT